MLINSDNKKFMQIKEMAESLGLYVFLNYKIGGIRADFIFLSNEVLAIYKCFDNVGVFIQQEDGSWVSRDNLQVIFNPVQEVIQAKIAIKNILTKNNHIINKIKKIELGIIVTEATIENASKFKSKWAEDGVEVARFENNNEKHLMQLETILERIKAKNMPQKIFIEDIRYILALANKEKKGS